MVNQLNRQKNIYQIVEPYDIEAFFSHYRTLKFVFHTQGHGHRRGGALTQGVAV